MLSTGLLVLLGYVLFMLGGIWLVERLMNRIERRMYPPVEDFGAPWGWNRDRHQDQDGTYQSDRWYNGQEKPVFCKCGRRLAPHEGPIDYGSGPVWECDTCLGVTS